MFSETTRLSGEQRVIGNRTASAGTGGGKTFLLLLLLLGTGYFVAFANLVLKNRL